MLARRLVLCASVRLVRRYKRILHANFVCNTDPLNFRLIYFSDDDEDDDDDDINNSTSSLLFFFFFLFF